MVFCWFFTRADAVAFWKQWLWLISVVVFGVAVFGAWRLGVLGRVWQGVIIPLGQIVLKTAKDWERKFALSLIGLLLGLIGMVFAVYSTYVATPKLSMEIVSRIDLLRANEIGGMDLTYKGVKLGTNQTVTMLLVKVCNDGNAALRKSAYLSPIGLQIDGGSIIQGSLASTSNAYLEKNVQITNSSEQVTFPPIVLEPHDFFLLKLLVLHSYQTNLSFHAFGILVGARTIDFKSAGKAG